MGTAVGCAGVAARSVDVLSPTAGDVPISAPAPPLAAITRPLAFIPPRASAKCDTLFETALERRCRHDQDPDDFRRPGRFDERLFRSLAVLRPRDPFNGAFAPTTYLGRNVMYPYDTRAVRAIAQERYASAKPTRAKTERTPKQRQTWPRRVSARPRPT